MCLRHAHRRQRVRHPHALPGESRCSPREIQNYLNRVSGPLLDRIDIYVEVPAVKFREITAERTAETSGQIRVRDYSLYPASDELMAAFKGELTPYRVSKGTLRFLLSEPVPVKLPVRFGGRGGANPAIPTTIVSKSAPKPSQALKFGA
jgi:hypothetical protein